MAAWRTIAEAGRLQLARFRAAAADPRAAQLGLLDAIVRANAQSAFGREHGFAAIGSLEEFRARVPVRDYARHMPWIERIRAGEKDALTAQAPMAWEETGGSGGGCKLVPCTQAGLAAFRRAVLPWLADLLAAEPTIAEGRAYFAVSPATRSVRKAEAGLPVGLPSDAAYLGHDLLPALSAVTLGAAAAGTAEFSEWQRRTLHALAAAEDLTLISVWSPTFLSTLLQALEENPEPVLRAFFAGEGTVPPMPERGRILEKALRGGSLDTARLWPKLRLLSAWADAGSARFADAFRARFPHARFQAKGLLATEGVSTFPLVAADGPVPALMSSFLEFADERGAIGLADELAEGEEYETVITTPGGFYRYRIGDRVRCTGFFREGAARLPVLRFLGRTSATLDLVGEKLEEGFVAACLSAAGQGFAVLVPAPAATHYLLLLESGVASGRMKEAAELALHGNPLYADARRVGQLGPLEPVALDKPVETYCAWRLKQGHRLGDIKLPVLLLSFEAAEAVWPELTERRRPVA